MAVKKLLNGAAVLMMLFFCASCGHKEKIAEIDFNDTVDVSAPRFSQGSGINICVGSMVTPEEGYSCYKKLLNYISKKLNIKVNFIDKRTYAEVNALLENGNIDMAFVCGGPYVEGHQRFGLELLAAPMVGGKTVYYSYIIVSEKSSFKTLEDLRGKTFAFADPMSNSGKLIPTYMLYELDETPQGFFREWIYTYDHDKSIKAVADGIVDGAAVDSLIWEYMNSKGSKYTRLTRIIKISQPYGIPPVVVRPSLDENLKLKLKNILLNLHNDEEGSAILKGMFIDRFVEVDDSIYDSIREVKTRMGE